MLSVRERKLVLEKKSVRRFYATILLVDIEIFKEKRL